MKNSSSIKNIILSLGLIAIPTLSLAAPISSYSSPDNSGVYVGLSGGYHLTHSTLKVSNNETVNGSFNSNGVMGAVALGYLACFGSENMAIEIDANKASKPGLSRSVGTQTVTRGAISASYSVNILPGLDIGKHGELFFRLGYERGHYEFKSTSGGNKFEHNTYLTGYNLGTGYAIKLGRHLSLRSEYYHTWFKHMNEGFSAITVTNKVRPSDNRFLVGLQYHFVI